ncbi:eukaryotic translation initiation factor 4 gamma 3-like isoform X2 [Apostichopus japonicus]|uniref:eukaryotic translation initiation factor 4 gamma 3-like isoform X2 n=1 Tax=Stichopus japonicus TaxID=307972 RepID=UPI003AB6795E
MSQPNSQVGVPPSAFTANVPFRPNQNIQYSGRPEDYSQNNRRQAHQIQQRHHGQVPSNSSGVPSPSASPGARRTPPHDMSKQGVRHSGQQPMSVNHQQALLYRMQPQAGQMHSMGFGIPSAAAPRTAPMQPASAPAIAPGSAGPRIMQHGTASGAPFGMQNPSFVPQHTMMPPAMYTSRTSNQYPQAAPPFSFPYFPATQSVQQNQGYYPPASQIPQVSYSPQAMQTQPPQSRNERKKKILRIQDPTSGEDLTESILRDGVVIPASSQVAGAGPSSSPPQHKEPESQQVQENRRIQAEFLTKVSQVASDPGSSELSKRAQLEDGAQPKGPVLAQIETSSPVFTPAVPAQISKPPVTTEEPSADASPPSAAASEAMPSEQVVVSDPKQEEQQVEEVAVESTPPTTEEEPVSVPVDDAKVILDAPKLEKPEPVKETDVQTTELSVTKLAADNKKGKKKKFQELDNKPQQVDMYEAFRSTESEVTEQTAAPIEEEPVASVVTPATVPSTEAEAPAVVVATEPKVEEAKEEDVKMEEAQKVEKSGADEEGNVVKEEQPTVSADVPEVETVKPEVKEQPPVFKEPAPVAPIAALPKEEAKTNNISEPPASSSKAATENATVEKVSKEETNEKVEDENAKNKEGEPKPEDNKIGLKYTYRDDQWSPLNQEGKKQYDRTFLLQFQPDCTSKPQGLPDIPDIVLEKADVRPHLDTKSMTSKGPDNLFMPTYMKSPRMNQQAPSFPQGNKRQSKERKIISRPSASQEETLKRSENAWKPDSKKKKKDSEDKDDDAELLRSFKSILNKLTPQNFQKLMNQTMQLPINSEERLTGVIDLVFEKAIMEPGFSQAYANMCRVMQNIEVTKADGSKVQFRKLIIIKCQKQFERQRSDEKIEMEKKRIAALSAKEQEEAQAELEYQQMIAKKQIIGNIRFIGELFKLSLLTEKIMQGCIFLLLKAKDEESLECMSKLVSTIGQSLDHQKGKALMDQYFNQVDKIIKEKKISSRIRFMLHDLKDLRDNNWKPRRNEAKPVMIDQIRKEAEMEKQKREQEQLTSRLAPRQSSKRPQGSMEKYQEDGGWNTVSGNRSTKQNVIENPAKLKITRQTIDDNVQLGPGGRPGSLGGWGKGSSGGGGKSSSGSSEAKISQGNRFMMLGEDKQQSRSMLPPSARDNKGRSSSGSKRSREREIDRSRERQSAIADTQRFTGSLKSRSNELDRNQEKRVEPPAAVALSEEEYEKRSRSTIKEFVSIKDFKEAITCLEELKSPKLQHVFVRVAIEDVLEKSSGMRESVGRLFHRLLQTSTISVEQFNDGLNEILEFAEDMEIDIPLYWTYLGEIIGAMAAEGATNFAFLRDVVQKIPREGKSAECMAEILKAGVNLTSETHMAKIWKTSNFTWSLFLPSGTNIQEFVKNKKVSFTEQPVDRVSQSTPKEETRIGNFQRDLILQFQNESLTNDEVFDFIEKSIPPDVRKTKEFIRALVSAVCFGAVKGEGTNSRGDHELLKKRSVLMQRYIDSDAKLELQALFAVQHLNYSLENPPGLLRLYFDVLYDEDVISEETFYSWRESDDAAEKTGKGIALKSVTSFYTWLEESDPPN